MTLTSSAMILKMIPSDVPMLADDLAVPGLQVSFHDVESSIRRRRSETLLPQALQLDGWPPDHRVPFDARVQRKHKSRVAHEPGRLRNEFRLAHLTDHFFDSVRRAKFMFRAQECESGLLANPDREQP